MNSGRTYGHYCGLARALDHVGDRWTLLVVRELLIQPSSYSRLQRQLHGISPNLLADRLATLQDDGLITRTEVAGQPRSARYALTPSGYELEPAITELIRWGARWMHTGPGDDHVDDGWAPLALRALLDHTRPTTGHVGNVLLDLAGQQLTISLRPSHRCVIPGWSTDHAATIRCTYLDALAVAAGGPFDLVADAVTGDLSLAQAALTP